MSLFNRYTDEGQKRFDNTIFESDTTKFSHRWARGDIIFLEVMQDCNQGGSYLRYFYRYKGRDYQVVPVSIKESVKDTPFVALQSEKKEGVVCEYKSENGLRLRYLGQRIADYVYHFTLKEIIQDLIDPRLMEISI